jgi:hypothetical protein
MGLTGMYVTSGPGKLPRSGAKQDRSSGKITRTNEVKITAQESKVKGNTLFYFLCSKICCNLVERTPVTTKQCVFMLRIKETALWLITTGR